jgi:hypothetical protein
MRGWAIGECTEWLGASDINRMTTQFARGGAAYCWLESDLSAAVASAITGVDSC